MRRGLRTKGDGLSLIRVRNKNTVTSGHCEEVTPDIAWTSVLSLIVSDASSFSSSLHEKAPSSGNEEEHKTRERETAAIEK